MKKRTSEVKLNGLAALREKREMANLSIENRNAVIVLLHYSFCK
jgi:hypothetical protein